MDAVPVINEKRWVGGFIVEIVVWEVPHPIPGSSHRYKYRLFFGRPGQRLVGYDNERGKGDHRHAEGLETRYLFVSLDKLLADFTEEIEHWRSFHENLDR